MKRSLIIIMFFALLLQGADSKKVKDEIDHLSLATLLLKDGHTQKASDELSKVDINDKKLDLVKYYTIKAIIATKNGFYKEANSLFLESIKAGQSDKSIFLYMAQNSFKLKEYKDTVAYLKKAQELALEKPSTFLLMAEALWRDSKRDEALAVLADGMKRFEGEYSFIKQRFNYYMSLELYQSALEDAMEYLKYADVDEKSSILFVTALKKAKQTDKAIKLAEKLNMKFERSVELKVLLAHLYLQNNMLNTAAGFFDKASIEDANFTKDSAEMYRRTKKFVLSLYKNSQILDVKEKLKQKIAIYLEYGDYEKVISAHAALKRSGLIEDENIRYALAYSYYMVGDFEKCETELKKLTRNDLFKKATELRKNIQKCKADGWECEL